MPTRNIELNMFNIKTNRLFTFGLFKGLKLIKCRILFLIYSKIISRQKSKTYKESHTFLL